MIYSFHFLNKNKVPTKVTAKAEKSRENFVDSFFGIFQSVFGSSQTHGHVAGVGEDEFFGFHRYSLCAEASENPKGEVVGESF